MNLKRYFTINIKRTTNTAIRISEPCREILAFCPCSLLIFLQRRNFHQSPFRLGAMDGLTVVA
jgi:hypothetical protein